MDAIEAEIALIINSNSPQRIAKEISALPRLGDYQLVPKATQIIHDRYLDTIDRSLRDRKIALRIREVNKSILITLKGPSSVLSESSQMIRHEIERQWSKSSFVNILEELRNREIQLNEPFYDDLLDPIITMKSAGLIVIQDRDTHRNIRDVIQMVGPDETNLIAEMAIDRVVHHFMDHNIQYYEIEIETKDEISFKALNSIVKDLKTRYGNEILIWKHSKLAMGMAIEKLLDDGTINKNINNNGFLKPGAYNTIYSYLKHL